MLQHRRKCCPVWTNQTQRNPGAYGLQDNLRHRPSRSQQRHPREGGTITRRLRGCQRHGQRQRTTLSHKGMAQRQGFGVFGHRFALGRLKGKALRGGQQKRRLDTVHNGMGGWQRRPGKPLARLTDGRLIADRVTQTVTP